MNSEVKEIPFASSVYAAELAIRNEVLRKPLGLDISQDDLSQEAEFIHLGIFVAHKLVGVCYLKEIDADIMQIKQVALLNEYQGNQLGRKLLTAAEERCRTAGKQFIKLEARQSAWGFYTKLAYYFADEPPFTQIGGVQKLMWKNL